ncbi:hypothetical protein BKA70DRAFT_121623 [Coprinopsis sp. MPI-PUGE-AT-0042]|nr:hypothetical protein BKA70DRAFT_121623 [Coprinopsis sp. MPI-PUGE-AT-0042]
MLTGIHPMHIKEEGKDNEALTISPLRLEATLSKKRPPSSPSNFTSPSLSQRRRYEEEELGVMYDSLMNTQAMNMRYQRDMLFRDSSPVEPSPTGIGAENLPNPDVVPTSEEDEIELEFENAIKAMSEADEAGSSDNGHENSSQTPSSDGTLMPPPSPRSVLASEVALYKAKYKIQLKRLKLDFIWINRLEQVLRDHGLPFPKYPDDLSYSSDSESHELD